MSYVRPTVRFAIWGFTLLAAACFPAFGQTVPVDDSARAPTTRRELTGADAKRAAELKNAIDAATNADRWDEAIVKQGELLAMRQRIQGPRDYETVDAEWALKTFRKVQALTREDRDAYRSLKPLHERASHSEIRRSLLTPNRYLSKSWRSSGDCWAKITHTRRFVTRGCAQISTRWENTTHLTLSRAKPSRSIFVLWAKITRIHPFCTMTWP